MSVVRDLLSGAVELMLVGAKTKLAEPEKRSVIDAEFTVKGG